MERAAQQQLLKFFESTSQLNPSCHSYRKGLSTTTTLLDILDEIYSGAEQNLFTSLMEIDQTAAFECVDKQLLLEKLARYNVGQAALQWINQYLSDRSQYVKIGKAKSRLSSVVQGVPQGSVIGPLLFAIYTNDITEVAKSAGCQDTTHQDVKRLFGRQCSTCGVISGYADDLTYTISNQRRHSNQSKIERTLDEMACYLNDNKLIINALKTQLTQCIIGQKRGKAPGDPPSLLIEKMPGGELKRIANSD